MKNALRRKPGRNTRVILPRAQTRCIGRSQAWSPPAESSSKAFPARSTAWAFRKYERLFADLRTMKTIHHRVDRSEIGGAKTADPGKIPRSRRFPPTGRRPVPFPGGRL